jgi:hypothetical protein
MDRALWFRCRLRLLQANLTAGEVAGSTPAGAPADLPCPLELAACERPDAYCIGADQTLALEGAIFPRDLAEAQTLAALSGKTLCLTSAFRVARRRFRQAALPSPLGQPKARTLKDILRETTTRLKVMRPIDVELGSRSQRAISRRLASVDTCGVC